MKLLVLPFLFSQVALAQHPTGLVVPKDWQKTAKFEAPLNSAVALPASFDWRTSGLTDIRNQGSCGSCWAFSTTAVIDDLVKLKLGVISNAAEQYLVSCNTQGWSCNGGYFAHSMHVNPGAVTESEYPYTGTDSACKPGGLSHSYKLASWAYLPAPSSGIPSVADIKNAIYNYGPVSVAVYADSNFQAYRGGVFSSCVNTTSINHAVNLVGWDDENQAWIMRNSWGSGWGEQGYMRIKYNCSNIGYAANYATLAVSPTPTPRPTATPSPKPTQAPSPKPQPTVIPTPSPTVTPPPCVAPVVDAGPDVNYQGTGVLILGTPAIKGQNYLWRSGKHIWRFAQIAVQPRRSMTYTLQTWNNCGVARDSVKVTVNP
jgi:hypothetical protein